MKRLLLLLVALVLLFSLSACGSYYSESDIEVLKEHAFTAGYNAGRSDGFRNGYEDGLEEGRLRAEEAAILQPYFEEYLYSVDDASEQIRIAQSMLEDLISDFPDAEFYLWDINRELESALNYLGK